MKLLLAWALPACLHSIEKSPPPPIQAPPEQFATSGDFPLPTRWWEVFEDQSLNALVSEAVEHNFQLRAAWARLEQAESLARQGGAALWPSLDLAGSGSYSRSVNPFFGAFTNQFYSLSVGASYELDLWGKLRAQRLAGRLEAEATRDELESLAMTIASQVTETWFSLVAQRAARDLVSRQADTHENLLGLVSLRYREGLVGAVDVHQQRQQLAASRAQLALMRQQESVLQQQLAVLLGKPPQEASGSDRADLPSLEPLPVLGVPLDLVIQRPDVRAAQRRVEAADARVGVAMGELLPSLRLSGGLGYSALELARLFDNIIWNIVSSLAQPLFDGGRRLAEVDRAKAFMREQVAHFGQIFLQALLEVESALAQEEHQRESLRELATQVEFARAAFRQARMNYTEGVGDFVQMLMALNSLQTAEQNELQARRQLISFRIQLCRALGGGWTRELRPPETKEG